MTKFMEKSFSTYAPGDDQYRKNWEAIFGKKKAPEVKPPEPFNDDSRVTDWWELPVTADREQYDCGGCDVCDQMFGRRS